MAIIKEIRAGDAKGLRDFVRFVLKHYRNVRFYVPPLLADQIRTLKGVHNPLFDNGEHAFFMAYQGKEAVGRICVGIDEKLNALRGKKQGWFALFECIDSREVAGQLFDAAAAWLKRRGMTTMIGPVSPTNGDDNKGVLINGFDGPPVLLNSYNFEYYPALYEACGFAKDEDHQAFIFYPHTIDRARYGEGVDRIAARHRVRVDRLDITPANLEREARDIKQVLDEGMDDAWEYTTPPSIKAITDEIRNLGGFYTKRFCFVARTYEGRPVGFCIALPDYNQVLIKMKGRILPFGWLAFLLYRNKINGVRAFVQFVVRDYQQRGVSAALFRAALNDFFETGMAFAEASTIGEYNTRSIASIERAGGQLYRSYRVYRREL